jgi:hypothetical protein
MPYYFYKGGVTMRCEYNDGLKVDYAGSLRITKGADVNVFLDAGEIPAGMRSDLDAATRNNSCGDIRRVAQEVTDIVGSSIPEK